MGSLGRPQLYRNNDTILSRFHTLAKARHLPVFFDDMDLDAYRLKHKAKDDDTIRNFIKVFQDGKERKRLG